MVLSNCLLFFCQTHYIPMHYFPQMPMSCHASVPLLKLIPPPTISFLLFPLIKILSIPLILSLKIDHWRCNMVDAWTQRSAEARNSSGPSRPVAVSCSGKDDWTWQRRPPSWNLGSQTVETINKLRLSCFKEPLWSVLELTGTPVQPWTWMP